MLLQSLETAWLTAEREADSSRGSCLALDLSSLSPRGIISFALFSRLCLSAASPQIFLQFKIVYAGRALGSMCGPGVTVMVHSYSDGHSHVQVHMCMCTLCM